jgi:uncharacterized protein YerC
MRRYKFLNKDGIFSALNRLRAALLAAKDGNDVEDIMNGILTSDERLKIGRRIEIAQLLSSGLSHEEIVDELKVGRSTIMQVSRKIDRNPKAFELINQRMEKIERIFNAKAYKKVGGPKLIFKKREYTGLTRKDVKR